MSLPDSESAPQTNREAAAQVVPALPYTPDETAYAVDPANLPEAKYGALLKSVDEGATMVLSVAGPDRSRELIELNRTEAAAYIRDIPDRDRFIAGKIREARARRALEAFDRLRGRDAIEKTELDPRAEAAMREFGMLEETRTPLEEGGYALSLRLNESKRSDVERRLREGFWDDGVGGSAYGSGYQAPTEREYRPPGGPANQQLLISDVWDQQAKCYWALTHDPVAKRACGIISDFVLGRGVQIIADDSNVQDVIDEFMDRDNIARRLASFVVDITAFGELFARLIPIGGGRSKVRTMPPETIWEIITDADDALDVYAYVQRYMTRVVLFAQNIPAARARWIERTIPADEMIHVKINAKESDVRGRSDLFPALGWMKRLRDYLDAKVQKEYASAAYQWDYLIKGGGQNDIVRIASSVIPAVQPEPGSFFLHNDLVEVKPVQSGVRSTGSEGDVTYETLLNQIALAVGLTKEYFGAASHMARASALIATEPAAKLFESRQDVIADFITKLLIKVIQEAQAGGILAEDVATDFRVVMPAIVKADAQARATMIANAEASNYITHRRAAEETINELEIDNYDYDEEMNELRAEMAPNPEGVIEPWQITSKNGQQVKKGTPTPKDVAFNPGEVPDPSFAGGDDGDPTPPGAGIDPAAVSPTSAVGAKNIRDQQGRGGKQDTTTMEAAIREARKSGAIVIIP